MASIGLIFDVAIDEVFGPRYDDQTRPGTPS
jgi:hypothetical protein